MSRIAPGLRASQSGVVVRDIDVADLRNRLRKGGQALEWVAPAQP